MPDRVVKDHESPDQSRTRTQLDLIVVSGLAFAARLAWVRFGAWVSGDSAWYLTVARNLFLHHTFSATADGSNPIPTAFRPPLYPALIAVLLIGKNSQPILVVLLLQAALGTATAALVYLIARDQFGRRIAVVASVGMALAPMTGRFTAVILSESLFTFLVTLSVFLWGRKRSASTGLMFGLAALTRVTMLPFVVLLPLLALLRPWRSQWRSYSTIMLLALAVGSIWIVRNAIVFHRFIPIASSGYGTNLLLGSLETKQADDVSQRKAFLKSVDGAGSGVADDETEADLVRLHAALRRIADSPGQTLRARAEQYPRLFIDSGSYLFGDGSTPFKTAIREGLTGQVVIRGAFMVGNLLVFFFALCGLIAERARFAPLSHITLFPIFLCVVSLPLWIEPRYGLPMMPLVAILAAVGFARGLKAFNRHGIDRQQCNDDGHARG